MTVIHRLKMAKKKSEPEVEESVKLTDPGRFTDQEEWKQAVEAEKEK